VQDGEGIKVEAGSVSWEQGKDPVLTDINLNIAKGELVLIIGATGSGKSALLKSFLGETHTTGYWSVEKQGGLGWAGQEGGLWGGSVQENICMGEELDEFKWQEVIKGCQLDPEIQSLRVGARGSRLSGGQAQRVGIARVAYSRPALCLLDDPLSSLDAIVAGKVWDYICSWQNTTRIVTTHSKQLCQDPRITRVFLIENGALREVKQEERDKIVAIPDSVTADAANEKKLDDSKNEEKEEVASTRRKQFGSTQSVLPVPAIWWCLPRAINHNSIHRTISCHAGM
jgi:ABC-type bacteriocin/lantibiotic exporter with double-glycine peptidase domain